MRFEFLNYGCKANQYETEVIKQVFRKNNAEITDSDADVCVINSCTVTEKIDKEILRKIRQLKKRGKKVVLTGCLAMRKDIGDVAVLADRIIPNDKKFTISAYPGVKMLPGKASGDDLILEGFSGKNKAFVKVEDGCNRFCTYCEVPFVRGSIIKSRSEEDVLKEIDNLCAAGYREIIITGINLGLYGTDSGGKASLEKLLKAVCSRAAGRARIRLSSVGPKDITDGIIKLAKEGLICPHFHMSLQSGSETMLLRMKRNYTAAEYKQKVEDIINDVPNAAITTDVIAGFPGETEKKYNETYDFIKNVKFSRLHVFSYSDRPDTKAFKMTDKVSGETIKKRVAALIALGQKKEEAFVEENTGKKLEMLVESKPGNGELAGYTDNYIRVYIKESKELINCLVRVKITERNMGKVFVAAEEKKEA